MGVIGTAIGPTERARIVGVGSEFKDLRTGEAIASGNRPPEPPVIPPAFIIPSDAIVDFSDVNISGAVIADLSGNGNDGVLLGNAGNLPERVVGGGPGGFDSIEFERANTEEIDLIANGMIIPKTTEGFTVSFWAKDDVVGFPAGGTFTMWKVAAPVSDANDQFWTIEHKDTSPAVDRMQVRLSQTGALFQECFAPYSWSSALKHVVLRYDRANLEMSMFVNGVEGTPVAIPDQDLAGTGVVTPEQTMNGGNNYPGEMSIPRWYARALTNLEIQNLYKEGL